MSEEPKAPRKRIAVAGASGFVGRALIEALRADYDVIALTRASPEPRRRTRGAMG